jgi:hypothetical protein
MKTDAHYQAAFKAATDAVTDVRAERRLQVRNVAFTTDGIRCVVVLYDSTAQRNIDFVVDWDSDPSVLKASIRHRLPERPK